MGQLIQRIKFVKFKDIIQVFPLFLGLICSFFLRLFRKNIWLVCERKSEARDNGYWFFKYLCENHPEIDSVYAIDFKSVDYSKVSKLGTVIKFGSLTHWIFYFAAKWNISSQKEGKPNAALCYLLEVCFNVRKNRVYLKHGIIKDYQRWIFNDVSKLTMLCCASRKEQEYIVEHFGYTKKQVELVGLCRFDNLLKEHHVKEQILIMPTMREWLRTISGDTYKIEGTNNVRKSEYFLKWISLINNNKFLELLDKYNVNVLFYPHPAMQKYVHLFTSTSNRVIIASSREYDMQRLLMESSMLITDYSSIYFDFAYMDKPLAYYQFDYDKYRKSQYQEGYYSYKDDGFGPVIENEMDLVEYIESTIINEYKNPTEYENRVCDFFAFKDQENCERTFQAIKKR